MMRPTAHTWLSRGTRLAACLSMLLGLAPWWSTADYTLADSSGTGITMHAVAGFGGQVRSTGWLPLIVDLRDDGADFSGKLVVQEEGNAFGGNGPGPQPFHSNYTAPVVLGSGSHKQITLYVPAFEAASGSLQVELDDGAGHARASTQVAVQTVSAGTLLAGVVSNDPGTARLLNGIAVDGSTVTAVALSTGDLVPVAALLKNFDLLVISNASTDTLNPAQGAALRQWVTGGGVLLVGGGPTARRTLAGLPPDLIPVRLTGTTTLSNLDALSRLTGTALPNDPVVAAVGVRTSGTVLAAQDGVPLVIDAARGRGHVIYSSLDLGLDPFSSTSAASPLWGALLGRAMAPQVDLLLTQNGGPGGPPGMQNLWGIVNTLNSLPSTAVPSLAFFIALIAVYILALGPLNYLILRRLRRQELSWITLPVLALLFCTGTFIFALQGKGRDVVLTTVSVVHLDAPTGPHAVESYVGLFSPTRSDYQLAVPGVALPQALPDQNGGWNAGSAKNTPVGLQFGQGAPTTVEFTNMNMWSMRAVLLQHEAVVSGEIDAQLHFGAGGAIEGMVTNHTGHTLLGAGLVTAGTSQLLGILAPGESRTVKLTPSSGGANGAPPIYQLYLQTPSQGAVVPQSIAAANGKLVAVIRGKAPARQVVYTAAGGAYYPGQGYNSSREIDSYQQVLQTVFQNGDTASVAPVLFVAWSHEALTPYTVNGERPRRQDLNLFLQPLWVILGTGPFTLPEGAVAAQLSETDGASQSGGTGLNIGPGSEATFSFAVPANGHIVRIDSLKINVSTNNGPSVLLSNSGALYDWQRQTWQTVDLTGGDTTIGNAGRFASPQGVIRLRLTAPDAQNLYLNTISSSIQVGATGTVLNGR